MKTFIKLILASALGIVLVACGNGESDQAKQAHTNKLEQIKANGVVRIGVFGDKPPFGYVDNQGHHQGFDVEIAKAFAKDLLGDENKVQFVVVEAANRVEYLQSDKVDIILANFTHTPARAEVVDFSKPYMKVALGVVSPNKAIITDIASLKGKTLIVNKGTTADIYFSKNHPEINLLKFEQNTETFEALRDGRGAALSHDNTLLFAWTKTNPGYTVGVRSLGDIEYIAPAIAKGEQALRKWIDQEVEQLSKDGRLEAAYVKTLQPVYGTTIDKDDILISE